MTERHPQGLTSEEARARLARFGPNSLGEAARARWLATLLRQFTGLLVLILIAAALIALALGETVDALAIGLIVLLNGMLGFVQEWRAENALASLRAMLMPQARVLRDGAEIRIDAREIVPGDIVLIAAGERVPADLRLIESIDLMFDESALTGESLPVARSADDPEPFARMGTSVLAGHGVGEVVATGLETAFGEIARLTGSVGRKPTHLQEVLARLARQLALAAGLLAALVAGVGVWLGHPAQEMFLVALSLAVAVVPEGLPAVVTITLALGAAAMVRQRALARRLQAIETLGAASVICTDKTGTLTENRMTATRIWMPGAELHATGAGHDPSGQIENPGGGPVPEAARADLTALLEVAALCNNARLDPGPEGWALRGTPTEGALLALAMKGGIDAPDDAAILAESPFSAERKQMSVLALLDGGAQVLVKGAPDRVLARCTRYRMNGTDRPLGPEARERIRRAHDAMAGSGLRVIAFARGEGAPGADPGAAEG
ncbi:MAG: cation-transporting P-type ATPase, partial [Alphaproteobacteria bacterium]